MTRPRARSADGSARGASTPAAGHRRTRSRVGGTVGADRWRSCPSATTITPLSKGFGFLVVVVAAAAIGGLGPGILASVVAFLTFNYFFLPPYDTFMIGRGEYVVVLFVFLGLSILISAAARAGDGAGRGGGGSARRSCACCRRLSAELVALGAGPGHLRGRCSSRLARACSASRPERCSCSDPDARSCAERVTVGATPGTLTPRWDPAPGAPARAAPALGRRPGARAVRAPAGTARAHARRRAGSCERSATSSRSCSSATGSCAPPPRRRSSGRRTRSGGRCWRRSRTTSAARWPRSRHR